MKIEYENVNKIKEIELIEEWQFNSRIGIKLINDIQSKE